MALRYEEHCLEYRKNIAVNGNILPASLRTLTNIPAREENSQEFRLLFKLWSKASDSMVTLALNFVRIVSLSLSPSICFRYCEKY